MAQADVATFPGTLQEGSIAPYASFDDSLSSGSVYAAT
jgi:hypothetical protein